MRLNLTQLNANLSQGLKPVYLITGDEPLQIAEATDNIRLAAKKAAYLNRQIFSVEGNFNWKQITLATESVSIFADKTIIDLKIPSAKLGFDGSKIITEYCQQANANTLLLISTAKLASASLKSRWVKAIERIGILVQVWPLKDHELIAWLQQRLLKRGLQLEQAAIKILASRIEGNLLAAAQEIEKLYILYGKGQLTLAQVQTVVADNSRFDVFNLTDAVLSGRVNRMIKILQGLQAEGIVAPVVLWALSRELRCLLELKTAADKELVFRKYHVFDNRKQLINKALTRLDLENMQQAFMLSAKADRQIKGQQSGDHWETLLNICLQLAAPSIC